MSVGQRTVRAGRGGRGGAGGRVSGARGGASGGARGTGGGGARRSLGRCTAAASAGATDGRYAVDGLRRSPWGVA